MFVSSELVILCGVNRVHELWGCTRGYWPIVDQSCIAANACASSEWGNISRYSAFGTWADLMDWLGLLICVFRCL